MGNLQCAGGKQGKKEKKSEIYKKQSNGEASKPEETEVAILPEINEDQEPNQENQENQEPNQENQEPNQENQEPPVVVSVTCEEQFAEIIKSNLIVSLFLNSNGNIWIYLVNSIIKIKKKKNSSK